MKAVLMGLTLGAATFLAMNAEKLLANEDHASSVQPVLYQPSPAETLGGFQEIASVSILAPQRIAWNQDASGLYVQALDSIAVIDPAQGSTTNLMDVPSNEMVLDISATGLVAVMRDFDAVVLRNAHDGSESVLAQGVNISSASFSPDGGALALVLDDGSVLQIWDVEAEQVTGEYNSPSLAEQAYSVTFAPSGESLTWFSVMGGQALDLLSEELGPFVAFSTGIYDVQMCSEDALVVANDGGTVTIWDTSTATIVHQADDLQAYSSSCSAEDEQLAVTTDTSVGLIELPALSGSEWLPVEAVDAELTQAGDRLAVVGADGTISVWQRN